MSYLKFILDIGENLLKNQEGTKGLYDSIRSRTMDNVFPQKLLQCKISDRIMIMTARALLSAKCASDQGQRKVDHVLNITV